LTCLAVLVAVVRSAADAEAAYRKLAVQCRAEYAAMQAGHDAELARLAADARALNEAHMDYLRAAKARLSEPAEGDEWKAGGP
jgi:phage host-nuclease inhibitor protein Gam